MEESDDDSFNQSTDLDKKTRDKILENEMRSFRNRGFHDGYDEGKKIIIQNAFDNGYQKAFEQNFILSTLRGVAQALIASHNLNSTNSTATTKTASTNLVTKPSTPSSSRPTSTTSSASTSSPCPSHSSTSSSSSINNSNINISSNHLSILESMNFDNATDIESIKNDLMKICRENRLEILAHYVSEIG